MEIYKIDQNLIKVEEVPGFHIRRSYNVYVNNNVICNTGKHGSEEMVSMLLEGTWIDSGVNNRIVRRIKNSIPIDLVLKNDYTLLECIRMGYSKESIRKIDFSEEQQIEAIEDSVYNVDYISNPTTNAQKAALDKDINIADIMIMDDEVIKYYVDLLKAK